MSKFIEAACINSFHSCNRAYAEVSISDTFSVFTTHMAGISGRRKTLDPIEPSHPPNTQAYPLNYSIVSLVPNTPGSQATADNVGSAEISLLLGSVQRNSQVGTNDDVTQDPDSNPYPVLGDQASGLDLMSFGPMAGSPDSTISNESDPLNLAFLGATTSHSTSMTGVNIQEGLGNLATTSSKAGRLTRHQVLIREARSFLETPSGDALTSASSSSQPNYSLTNLSTRSSRNARNTRSQVVASNHRITSSSSTRINLI